MIDAEPVLLEAPTAQANALYERVLRAVACGGFSVRVGAAPGPEWMRVAFLANLPDLAEDLLVAFGGAVLPHAQSFDAAFFDDGSRLAAWQASVLPFSIFGGRASRPCPCAHRFRVPGYWPPPGSAALTNDQVIVLIETGDLDALRDMHAGGRLVPPDDAAKRNPRTAFYSCWVARALSALRPDIADWLLATFGRSRMRPIDNGKSAAIAVMAPLRGNEHHNAALAWLERAVASDWYRSVKSAAKTD